MPMYKSNEQQLLESLALQILSFNMLYLQSERHKMGSITDEEYKNCLEEMYVTASSLLNAIT